MSECPCGKICYSTPGRAVHVLARQGRRKTRTRTRPTGHYHCPECGHWHVTSNPQDVRRKRGGRSR